MSAPQSSFGPGFCPALHLRSMFSPSHFALFWNEQQQLIPLQVVGKWLLFFLFFFIYRLLMRCFIVLVSLFVNPSPIIIFRILTHIDVA